MDALIVWGGWPGHEPEEGAKFAAGFLADHGIRARVTNDLEALADPAIANLALVVINVTNGQCPPNSLANLVAAVRGGVGLAGFHGGLAASFRAEVSFHFMCGSQWVAHPGNIVDYRVEVTRRDDPLMAGITDFDYRSEQYYLHFDPSIEVLATTKFDGKHDAATSGVIMPVVYKRLFGEGRVFYSALGHSPSEFMHPSMRAILSRGLAWAARADHH